MFLFYVLNVIFGDSASCRHYKKFYENKVNGKIISIKEDDLNSKGLNIFYYINKDKDLFFYQNTLSFYEDFERLHIGDSIVKEPNETDFDIYRDGVFYKRAELGCICDYCN